MGLKDSGQHQATFTDKGINTDLGKTWVCVMLRNAISRAPGGKACVQNGISGSYLNAVFEFRVHKASDIWILHNFTKVGLLQLLG